MVRLILPLLVLASGCATGTPIELMFSQLSGTPATVPMTYDAPAGTASVSSGVITLNSKLANGTTLVIEVDNPPYPVTIPLGEFCLVVDLTLASGAAWGSSIPNSGTPGTITFMTTTSPYKVQLKNMQMIAATSGAQGSFFLDGSAEYN